MVGTAASRSGRQVGANDFTGRKREALQKEQVEALVAREGELTTVSNERARSVNEDVIDYSPDALAAAQEAAHTEAQVAASEGEQIGSPGSTPVYALPEEVNLGLREAVPADRLNDLVVIRIAADIEDMTFGAGNLYTFAEGRRYRVPRYIAVHLEEKGLVYH